MQLTMADTAEWTEKSPDWYTLEILDYVAQVVRIGTRWKVRVYRDGVELNHYSRTWHREALDVAETFIRAHHATSGDR